MKAPVCDVCLAEKKLTLAPWRRTLQPGAIKMDLCAQHKANIIKSENALEILAPAQGNLNAMIRE